MFPFRLNFARSDATQQGSTMRIGPQFLLTVALIAATTNSVNATDRHAEEATCSVVEEAARTHQVSVEMLTRLIWFESRFDIGAISHVGAEGIAQFMPATAAERGLSDPFDVDQAILQAASYLADLNRQFGNFGLAIAAYNAGPHRVANWLDNSGALPRETSFLVLAVTGRSAEDWAAFGPYMRLPFIVEPLSCLKSRAILRSIRSIDYDPDRGRLTAELKESGRSLPTIAQSGRLLRDIGQSGFLIRGMVQSSRALP
jgi:hypothetical protein